MCIRDRCYFEGGSFQGNIVYAFGGTCCPRTCSNSLLVMHMQDSDSIQNLGNIVNSQMVNRTLPVFNGCTCTWTSLCFVMISGYDHGISIWLTGVDWVYFCNLEHRLLCSLSSVEVTYKGSKGDTQLYMYSMYMYQFTNYTVGTCTRMSSVTSLVRLDVPTFVHVASPPGFSQHFSVACWINNNFFQHATLKYWEELGGWGC